MQLLELPDALLLRVLQFAGDDYGPVASDGRVDINELWRRPMCCGRMEALLRLGPEEPRVDVARLCRLRLVCRRLAGLVDTGGSALPANLDVWIPYDRQLTVAKVEAELERTCEGAARGFGGVEDLHVHVRRHPELPELPAFSLAPLARFRSLRALRLEVSSGAAQGPGHVSPLASLPLLAALHLRWIDPALSPAALAALYPLPLTALYACLRCGSLPEACEAIAALASAFPLLERLHLIVSVRHWTSKSPPVLPPSTLAALSALTRLRSLSLNGDRHIASLRWAAPLSRLEHLAFDAVDRFDRNELRALSTLPLRPLDFDWTHSTAADASIIASLRSLEILRVGLEPDSDPDDLVPLAPRLRVLRLQTGHAPPAADRLAAFLASCTALERLELTDLRGCVLEALGGRSLAGWRNVRELALEHRAGPLPAGLLARVASELPRLSELTLRARSLPLVPPFCRRLRRLRVCAPSPDSQGDQESLRAFREAFGARFQFCSIY